MAAGAPTGKLLPSGEDHDLIVLAGGAGSRLDHADKGLIPVRGRPLLAWLLDNVAGDARRIIISANRNQAQYRTLGDQVISDRRAGYSGPLAGIEAALAACEAPLCVVLPCDMPHLPGDLPGALLARLGTSQCAVYLHDGNRAQPLCLALRCAPARASLADYLDSGARSVIGWLEQLGAETLDGSHWPARCWDNINDHRALEQLTRQA